MDGTSTIIVVVLFVATIMSSFGSKGYTPPSEPPQEIIQTEVSLPQFDPTYFEVVGETPRQNILNYVSKYRNQEEAESITEGIMKYSQSYGVNPKLVAALMARESRFNPSAVSSSGAVGLGQLLPSTCNTVGISDPYDVDQNAKGTVRYLKYLLDRFSKYEQRVSFAIAGYLEGPNVVERNLSYSTHAASYIKDIFQIYQNI